MSSKLIEIEGVVFEAEVPHEEAVPLSSNSIENVAGRIEDIKPILLKLSKPFSAAWEELNNEIEVAQAEISLGLTFLGEGNFFISKVKAGTNINVKLVFKPK